MRRAGQRLVWRDMRWVGICVLGAVLSFGCDADTASSVFNPAFVETVAPPSDAPAAGIDNAPGHVPVIFVNNLHFDTQLTAYLEELSAERRLSGLETRGADLTRLRPRVRMRMLITYENGNTLPFEFVSGDSAVEIERRDEDEDELDPIEEPLDPVLTQNDLTRLVATCPVARVELDGDPQVYMPVFVRVIRIVIGEFGFRQRVLQRTDQPQFRPVLPDQVDANLNITLRRNYNVRESPAPAQNLACGSMVGIVVEGTVSAPFTQPEDDPEDDFIAGRSSVPGFVTTDTSAEASIPGRFKFTVQVR